VTCAEFHELVMHYALGALDDAERETCEAHLRQAAHPGCFEALRKASAAVALVPASLEPVAPAAGTWAAIEGALGRESDAAIADRGPTPIRARGPRRRPRDPDRSVRLQPRETSAIGEIRWYSFFAAHRSIGNCCHLGIAGHHTD